ncbi:MAG: ferritin family protein [Chloroflexota bacterium]|jgi:rubrerythrin
MQVETIGKLFEYAIQMEESAEVFYRRLGELFSPYPAVADFWLGYADEEHAHAAILRQTRDTLGAEELAQPARADLLRDVHRCFELASAKTLQKIRDLEEAYQLAIELETSETNAVFEFLILNFSTRRLIESENFLKAQLRNHVARLEKDFPSEYRSRIKRRNTIAKPVVTG